MTRKETSARAALLGTTAPAYMGRFEAERIEHDFFVGTDDLERDTRWLMSIAESYGIGHGTHVVFTTAAWHTCWYEPFREAVRRVGGIVSNAEMFDWDAKRLSMFLRRLPVHAVIGSPRSLLEAFEAHTGSVSALADVPCLLLESSSVDYLAEFGIAAGAVVRLGPALLVAAADGSGMQFDEQEWTVEAVDGRLTVSSRHPRATEFSSCDTAIAGTVEATANGVRIHLKFDNE